MTYFSARIEQSSKKYPKMALFSSNLEIFEDCSILAEKQRLKPRKLNSLMNFASLDAQLDPKVARLAEWNESGVKKPSVWQQSLHSLKIEARVLRQIFVKIDIVR